MASVDDRGLVNDHGAGEAAIKVWYLNHNAMAFMTVPYAQSASARNVRRRCRGAISSTMRCWPSCKRLRVPPSPPCDDATFIRRAFLDTIGTLPTADEARAFLADASADKRDRLIDSLLARPEFADYWAYKWADVLLISGQRLRPKALEAYYNGSIRASRRISRGISSSARSSPPPAAPTKTAPRIFTPCIKTPRTWPRRSPRRSWACRSTAPSATTTRWKNGPTTSTTRSPICSRASGPRAGGAIIAAATACESSIPTRRASLIQPSRGKPQPPCPLDGQPLAFDATDDRRLAVADWLTSPENPYFTRAIVNRVWANFFGVGLVEAVDDLRLTNPASNEELLNGAANISSRSKYDLKELMRAILQSETYQRASEPSAENKADERFYSPLLSAAAEGRGAARRHRPGHRRADRFQDGDARQPQTGAAIPNIKRAIKLARLLRRFYFLEAFGKPDRLITCECERSSEPSMTQVLHLYNGETVNKKLAAAGSAAEKALAQSDNAQIVEDLYLAALSRPPTAAEREPLVAELSSATAEERRQTIEDLYWSVLTSREFSV